MQEYDGMVYSHFRVLVQEETCCHGSDDVRLILSPVHIVPPDGIEAVQVGAATDVTDPLQVAVAPPAFATVQVQFFVPAVVNI
jgi:hypothetical protein